MRIRVGKKTLALTTPLALAVALAACSAENESVNAGEDDLPESEIYDQPDANTGEQMEGTVPGVEEAYPEGDTPNTADIEDENDAVYTDPEENPPQQP